MIRSILPFPICVLAFLLVFPSCSDDGQEVAIPGALLYAKRYDNPGIYDSQGRFILMRGVNLNTLGDYWAANIEIPPTAPYEPDHFRLMASYGFNVVRLLFHWSAVEPERGQYDYEYIARIRQAVEDAAEYGVYVQLDMHQDAYSKYIATPSGVECDHPAKGWDGAPDWATLTDGESTCTDGGRRESSPAAYRSWRNFWINTDGIRDACIAAWQEVVKATADHEYLLGYDAINEPSLGDGDLAGQLEKYNNYLRELLSGIREAEKEAGGFEHIFFFETTVGWNGEQVPSIPAFDFALDQNVVFAPHNYFEVIGPPVLTIEEGAQFYDNLSAAYGTHCFVGEWGVFGNPQNGLSKLKRFAAAEDEFLMSSTWWQWCQAPGDPHGINWAGDQYAQTSLHLLEVASDGNYTGVRNDLFLNVLSRARPVAIHGKPIVFQSDPESGSMTLRANAPSAGITEIWIPDQFGVPSISGTNSDLRELLEVEGGYHAFLNVKGTYEIRLGS